MDQNYPIELRELPGFSATQLDNRMLSDQVVSFLTDEVRFGRLRSGQRVNEAELARHLGISRNPIREAVRRLEERGMLVSAPRRGTFVRSFSKKDIDDIFSFRLIVENFALEQGLSSLTDGELSLISGHVHAMEIAAQENNEPVLVGNDLAFHERLCNLSNNRQTIHAFLNIKIELQMLIGMAGRRFDTLHAAAADHWPVVEALASRRIDLVANAISEHIHDSWRRLSEAYENSHAEPLI